jgi:hypothetical protein
LFTSVFFIDLVLIDQQSVGREEKEKSPSDGHYQCEKEMEDQLTCQQFLKESHEVTYVAIELASFLKFNDIFGNV